MTKIIDNHLVPCEASRPTSLVQHVKSDELLVLEQAGCRQLPRIRSRHRADVAARVRWLCVLTILHSILYATTAFKPTPGVSCFQFLPPKGTLPCKQDSVRALREHWLATSACNWLRSSLRGMF